MLYREYDYEEIIKAVREDANEYNVNELGEWCVSNLNADWNGEYWTCDEFRVYPIHQTDAEGYIELIGYELR